MKTIPLFQIASELKWWTDRYPLIADGNKREIELSKYWITYSGDIHGSEAFGGSDEYGNHESVFIESGRYVDVEVYEYDEDGNETQVYVEGLEDYIKNNLS